ncbi:MAG: hypothetical protein KC457_21770, partial [Myxococcales bacterium]|nr:hypothetical protein [Myxococcales bacterium]
DGGGWTLAVLDAAGGTRVVTVSKDGSMRPRANLPPTEPMTEVLVLPGGQRFMAIGGDHVIHLYDVDGRELAHLDSPGLRPAQLRMAMAAEGGPRVLALTAGEFDAKEGRFSVELLPLDIGEGKLAVAADRQTIFLDSPASRDNPTLSPDGRTAVFLQRQRLGGATWRVVAMQLDDGRQVSVDSKIDLGNQPRLSLLPEGRVLLDDGTGMGRVVDLGGRKLELRPLRSNATVNHLAGVSAGSLRVMPASNWLAVHDLGDDDLLYLGYEQINVMDAGLGANGRQVAWALADRVVVESLGDRPAVVEVPGTRNESQRFVDFVDAETLLTLDWNGGAELVRWTDGEVIDAVDLGNNVQTADYAGQAGGGVLLVRTSLWQNPTVAEIHDRSFGARFLLPGQSHLIGLSAPQGQSLEHWGSWSLDGSGRLQRYDLEALRAGIDTETAGQAGEVLSFGVPEQLVVDGRGRMIWVRTTGARSTLTVSESKGDQLHERSMQLPAGFVTWLQPSPDDRRLAVVQQRDPAQVVTVYDLESLQPLWAQPIPAVQSVTWSDDGGALAVPAQFGGGVVFAGDDGEIETARCGLAFEAKRTPPVVQGFFVPMSVCGL